MDWVRIIRRPNDFLTGLLFAALAVGAIVIAQNYNFGSVRQMGPGFFPTVLATILLGIAAVLLVRSFFGERDPIGYLALRPLFFVLGSALLFALLLRPAGMLVATIVMVTLASYAKPTLSLPRIIVVGVVLAAASALLFVYLLGQNIPLLGTWFGA